MCLVYTDLKSLSSAFADITTNNRRNPKNIYALFINPGKVIVKTFVVSQQFPLRNHKNYNISQKGKVLCSHRVMSAVSTGHVSPH